MVLQKKFKFVGMAPMGLPKGVSSSPSCLYPERLAHIKGPRLSTIQGIPCTLSLSPSASPPGVLLGKRFCHFKLHIAASIMSSSFSEWKLLSSSLSALKELSSYLPLDNDIFEHYIKIREVFSEGREQRLSPGKMRKCSQWF